ncbi:MAG: endonuclease/exonuclease/phosphatase family protein [Deltaproteobacteria bacterium]|nr:endonuclease/exonuclease/phosphatase family protein [Deltaproteobacteria bacterium]
MTTASATLDILTLNTWGFRWPLARHRKARFGRIQQHLREASYDVVALQELWRGAPEVLGDTGMAWAGREGQTARKTRMVDSGLGVKVRRGFERSVQAVMTLVRSFARHSGFDRAKHKGIFGVELAIDNIGPVTLVNTHLQASRGAARVRRTQLDEILAAVDTISTPVILCGDFNLFDAHHEDRAGHRSLGGAGFHDASETIDRPDATYLTKNPYVGGSEDERFDRIYLRDGVCHGQKVRIVAESVKVIVDHGAPMSDHEAVAARLRLVR